MEEGLRKKFEESLDRRFKSYRSSFHIPARVAGESVTNVASERARMEERMERVIGLWSYRGTASERFPEILSTKFPELSAKSYSHVRTRSKRMSKSKIPGSKSQGNLDTETLQRGATADYAESTDEDRKRGEMWACGMRNARRGLPANDANRRESKNGFPFALIRVIRGENSLGGIRAGGGYWSLGRAFKR